MDALGDYYYYFFLIRQWNVNKIPRQPIALYWAKTLSVAVCAY